VFDPCRENDCQNNGVCKDTDTAFKCECPMYYFGKLCEGETYTVLSDVAILLFIIHTKHMQPILTTVVEGRQRSI